MKGEKVLVTGADGFIGSHLVEELVSAGYKVRAFVYYNSFNSWGWLDTFSKEILKDVEIFSGDIRDPHGVKNALDGMDGVFHLAALIAIPYSYVAPDNYVDTNIKGTLNILQGVRELNLRRVVVTSTSEVYGTAKYVPIDENHPKQGQSPYSATKIGADSLTDSFYRSFRTPVTIVRPFNTYGPRQSARAVIPSIITQIFGDVKEIKLGSLHPTRDLVYVKDTVVGFRKLYECSDALGEEVNIATMSEVTVGDLAEKIQNIARKVIPIVSDGQRIRPEKSEVERLFGSNEKLRKLTGWSPETSLDDGLSKTIEWFSNPENLKAYKYNIYNI